MKRIDLDYLVITGLLLGGLYVFITGLVTDLLGLHQFVFHRYAGYASALLISLHVTLHWGRIKAYLRWRLGGSPILKSLLKKTNPLQLSRRDFLLATISAVGGYAVGQFIPPRLPSEIETTDLGSLYHQWSSPKKSWDFAAIQWGGQPERYKTYTQAKRISLPAPLGTRGLTVEKAIEQRRSVRNYSNQPLSLNALSRLLHSAQGITEPQRSLRAAPSAGALYPLELYPIVHNVSGLDPGIYHYAVQDHELETLSIGDQRAQILQAGIWQEFLGEANVCFVLTAIFQRTRWKYQQRAYRYVLFEAGHIAQNIYLSATSMSLGACAVGAFLDGDLNSLLGTDDEEEEPLYIISVGTI
jgi:SagB-type dehydrogenase family enzyme